VLFIEKLLKSLENRENYDLAKEKVSYQEVKEIFAKIM